MDEHRPRELETRKKLKILYVGRMATPLRDILSGKTAEDARHLPGFFQPWYRLAKRGHQVDFVVTSNDNVEADVKVDWFSENNLKANIYDPALEASWHKRIFRRLSRLGRLAYHTNRAIRRERYDFIVCWAFYEGLVGNIFAKVYGIPCGMRAMGTMLYPELQRQGAFKLALRKPAEYLSFRLPKSYFLMTDDGTRGDAVYQAWRPRKERYKYLFWKTGVEVKPIDKVRSRREVPTHPYLFFAARFDPWKRHDKVVRMLKNLHEKGYAIHLYFCGSVQSEKYLSEVKALIAELGLKEYVCFLGSIAQDDLRFYAYYAVANPFFYDFSNLGNVFFESFATGSVVIGLNDGSLDGYIENGKNGFLVDDFDEAVDITEKILNDEIDIRKLRENAFHTSQERVIDRNERFDAEANLIEAMALGRQCDLGTYENGLHTFPVSISK
ncbi:glycosyltransferase [Endozoicomonas sp. G2_2]|uniref:glycosyltransferase n=1 Tax=Endozoicomonas sp. G2_2 TaxID=2821092 RepID=UPI001ADCDD50|nr:glycosyltransferase [Endozoicomonas sp. G2_2]MBO9470143.1 glycosyltransferase [Endozoicomonas sp. G2_2]